MDETLTPDLEQLVESILDAILGPCDDEAEQPAVLEGEAVLVDGRHQATVVALEDAELRSGYPGRVCVRISRDPLTYGPWRDGELVLLSQARVTPEALEAERVITVDLPGETELVDELGVMTGGIGGAALTLTIPEAQELSLALDMAVVDALDGGR